MKKLLKITLTLFFITIIVLGFAVPVNMAGNWYQQFLPNIGGRTIKDITFTDSLNGHAVTSEVSDTSFILRTTNGGDNWFLSHFDTGVCTYNNIQFINQNTGIVSGYIYNGSTFRIVKTTNGGVNWFYVNHSSDIVAADMFVLNQDTIWLVDSGTLAGGVYRTINGGVNWSQQFSQSGNNPAHIYMYNARIGFIDGGVGLRKTTDSGLSWTPISGAGNFLDMYFTDSLTGWKSNLDMKKTTNGGLNWITLPIPQGGNILLSQIVRFHNVNKDTIWGAGSTIITGSGNRAMICRTTNGGATWMYQVPDSTYNIFQYQHIQFTGRSNGWAYSGVTGVHTTNGGDPVWITPIKEISIDVPKEFMLYQNYPNPFNPVTKIKYELKNPAIIKLIVFDIQGKEIEILENQKQNPGIYETIFSGNNLSSGTYFYSLIAEGKLLYTKKMILIK